jgi:hypothetical protein
VKGFKSSSKSDPLGPQSANAPVEQRDDSWLRGSGGSLGNYSNCHERRGQIMGAGVNGSESCRTLIPSSTLEVTAASAVRTWSESSGPRPRPSESPIQTPGKAAGFALPGEVRDAIHQAAIGVRRGADPDHRADEAHRASPLEH